MMTVRCLIPENNGHAVVCKVSSRQQPLMAGGARQRGGLTKCVSMRARAPIAGFSQLPSLAQVQLAPGPTAASARTGKLRSERLGKMGMALRGLLLVACCTCAAAQCGPDQNGAYVFGTTVCPTRAADGEGPPGPGSGSGSGEDGGGGGDPPGGDGGGEGAPVYKHLSGEENSTSCTGGTSATCSKTGGDTYVERSLTYDSATGKMSGQHPTL